MMSLWIAMAAILSSSIPAFLAQAQGPLVQPPICGSHAAANSFTIAIAIRISFRPLREYGLKLLVLSLEQLGSVGRARFRVTGLIIPGVFRTGGRFAFRFACFSC